MESDTTKNTTDATNPNPSFNFDAYGKIVPNKNKSPKTGGGFFSWWMFFPSNEHKSKKRKSPSRNPKEVGFRVF